MPETFLDQAIYMAILMAKILAVIVPLILAVAYYTYACLLYTSDAADDYLTV